MKIPEIQFKEDDILQMFEKADTFVTTYSKKGETMTIQQLLNLEDKIATAIYFFGEISAEYNKDYSLAYANRVYVRASRLQKAIMEDMKITAVKEVIETQMLKERQKEIQMSYFAERVVNLIKGLNKVLDAISRRLLYLRDEKKVSDFHSGKMK